MKKKLVFVLMLLLSHVALASEVSVKKGIDAYLKKNYTHALKIFLSEGNSNNPTAQSILGEMYDNGLGVNKDEEKALNWYLKAAEQGGIGAQYNLGIIYSSKGDYKKAYKWYLKAAMQGDAESQYIVGMMHRNGDGVKKDHKLALTWFIKAAEKGDVLAQRTLGILYERDVLVPESQVKSAKWYRKAAEQGDSKSQSELGLMYFNGTGVPMDYIQAYVWTNISASGCGRGLATSPCTRSSIIILKTMANKMSPIQIKTAESLSLEYLKKYSKN